MKVHITLEKAIRQDREARSLVLDRLKGTSSLHAINERRFERHGIISGEVTENCVAVLENQAGVKSVSIDQKKHATSPG